MRVLGGAREGKCLSAVGALGAASGKVPLETGISHLKCFRTLMLFLATLKLQRASLRWYFTGWHSWLKHPPASPQLWERDEGWREQHCSRGMCPQNRGLEPCRSATRCSLPHPCHAAVAL